MSLTIITNRMLLQIRAYFIQWGVTPIKKAD